MNNEITLTDLFEVEMLQRLQDSFSKMTGFAAIITGLFFSMTGTLITDCR